MPDRAQHNTLPRDIPNIYLSRLVPRFLRRAYGRVRPTSDGKVLTCETKHGLSIDDLRASLTWDVEFAGTLGNGWAQLQAGSSLHVLSQVGVFTWHTHTDKHATFSIFDFMSFAGSTSLWHLLLTERSWRLYLKTRCQAKKFFLCETPSNHGLFMVRVQQQLETTFQKSPESLSDKQLCEYFNMRSFDMQNVNTCLKS